MFFEGKHCTKSIVLTYLGRIKHGFLFTGFSDGPWQILGEGFAKALETLCLTPLPKGANAFANLRCTEEQTSRGQVCGVRSEPGGVVALEIAKGNRHW